MYIVLLAFKFGISKRNKCFILTNMLKFIIFEKILPVFKMFQFGMIANKVLNHISIF
jgi:hypothetical protein